MPRIDIPYPPPPTDPPDGPPDDPAADRRVVAAAGAAVLVLAYAGLTAAAGVAAVGLIAYAVRVHWAAGLLAVPLGFLALFLARAFVRRYRLPGEALHVPVSEAEQPRLYGFVRRVCDDLDVSPPDRIVVAPDAAVLGYDRCSLLSLVVPPRRELAVGLGLVNVLNLSEFRAVVAAASGASAGWGFVPTAADRVLGVAATVLLGEDWFDAAVRWLKGGPARPLGVVMGWAAAATRLPFALAYRAFDRGVPDVDGANVLRADMAAAGVAGTNALVHALYRGSFAERALARAWDDLRLAADRELYTTDLFYHQHAAADRLRRWEGDPYLGLPPDLADPRDGRRVQVFDPDRYGPGLHDREERLKASFVPAADDPRPAWVLFDDPADLRERVTYRAYRVELKAPKGVELTDPKRVQEVIDDERGEAAVDPKYQGAYGDRPLDPGAPDAPADGDRWDDARLAAVFAGLYAGVREKADERRAVTRELEAVYRSKDRRARRRVEDHEAQLADVDRWFAAFDRRVFLVHVQMADRLGPADARGLIERYRFHAAVEAVYRAARRHRRRVEFYSRLLAGGSAGDRDEAADVLRDARRDLRAALRGVEGARPPKGFGLDDRPREVLLPGAVVPEPAGRVPDAGWADRLVAQLTEVEGRAARLRARSLGGLLALQEKVAAAFLARQQVTPV